MVESDVTSLSESTRRLIADLQKFLDSVEPIFAGHRTSPNAWSPERQAEVQDACNQVHYLWTRLEMLERHLHD